MSSIPEVRLLFACMLVLSAPLAEANATPNILWIITDDHSTDMGAYGTPAVSTPRMDQLAAEGVLYQNAYTTSPACSPSRTAMMTGVYQTSIPLAMHHRPASRQPLPAGVAPISDYFRNEGYFVGNATPDFTGNGKMDMNFANPDGSALAFGDLFDGNDWRSAGSSPWFMQVNIFEPHRSFRGANTDPSRPGNLALPADLPDHPIARADYADYLASIESADVKVGAVLDRLEADGLADNTIVFFFGDNGREFTRAKSSSYDAGYRVPLVVRVPEAYRAGRADLAPGVVDDGLVSMLDVTAASLAAAGVDLASPAMQHLHGGDLLAHSFTGRDYVVGAADRSSNAPERSRMIRAGDLAYIKNYNTDLSYFGIDVNWYSKQERPIHTLLEVMKGRGLKTADDGLVFADQRPAEELYDLASDPHQLNNLADDPAYATEMLDFRTRLRSWKATTGDLGGEFDPDLQPGINWYNSTGRYRHLDDKDLPRDTTDYEYLQWWSALLGEPIDLPQGAFDLERYWVSNASFENTPLGDGGFSGGVPQGWSDATAGVWVQNQTAGQMSPEAADGSNVLVLDAGGAEVRWAIDDNWGSTLEAEDAAAYRFRLETAVGRRNGSQGETPGQLRLSLQTESGTRVVETFVDADDILQGAFAERVAELLLDRTAAQQHRGETLYLSLANIADDGGVTRGARLVLDDIELSLVPLPRGDFNYDGVVDNDDLALWRNTFGSTTNLDADGNLDGVVDIADYTAWRDTLGATATAIPEPQGALIVLVVCGAAKRRRTARSTT